MKIMSCQSIGKVWNNKQHMQIGNHLKRIQVQYRDVLKSIHMVYGGRSKAQWQNFILTSINNLYDIILLKNNLSKEWFPLTSVKRRGYYWCYTECLPDEEATDTKELYIEEGRSNFELVTSFYELCVTESDDTSSCDLKTNVPYLLSVLVEKTIINNISSIIFFSIKCNIIVDEVLLDQSRFVEKKLMSIFNKIKKEMNKYVRLLDSNTVEELEGLYNQLNIESVYSINYLIDALPRLEYSTDLSRMKPPNKVLKYIKKMREEIECYIEKADSLIKLSHFLGLYYKEKFPIVFFLEDLRLDGITSIRSLLSGVTKALNDIIRPRKLKILASVQRINIKKMQMLYTTIETTLTKMDAFIESTILRLLNYFHDNMEDPLSNVLALLLYIIKRAETKNRKARSPEFYNLLSVYNLVPIDVHLQTLNDMEMQHLALKKERFQNFIYSLFSINLTDKNVNLLSERLANSEQINEIMNDVSRLVTMKFFKNFLCFHKSILNKIFLEMDSYLVNKRKLKGKFDKFPLHIAVYSNVLRNLRFSLKTQNKLFEATIKTARNRRRAADLHKNRLCNVKKFQNFLKLLLLLEEKEKTLWTIYRLRASQLKSNSGCENVLEYYNKIPNRGELYLLFYIIKNVDLDHIHDRHMIT